MGGDPGGGRHPRRRVVIEIGQHVREVLGPVLLGPVLLGPALQGAAGVGPVAVAFFAAVAIVAGATLVLALTRRPTRALFRLTMLAALLLSVQLVATAAA